MMNMACYAKNVIAIALAEVGYLEKETNKNLTSKTANAGDENYTKYAYDFDKTYVGFYNTKKQGAAWCDIFVDWCLVKAFGVNAALKLLGQPKKSYGAGCTWSVKYYKQIKRFYTSPKVGDQIFFKDSKGEPCHTGLVYKVDSTYVYTVEGNTSSAAGVVANGGAVAKKKYKLNYSRIYGYGRPKYDVEKKTPTKTTTTKTTSSEKVSDTKMPTIQEDSTGKAVRLWQVILGFTKDDVDGKFGPDTKEKTIAFQKKVFPKDATEWDGIVGPKTWKAGLESV